MDSLEGRKSKGDPPDSVSDAPREKGGKDRDKSHGTVPGDKEWNNPAAERAGSGEEDDIDPLAPINIEGGG